MGGSFREFTWADTNMWLPHLVASSFLNKCLSMAKGSLIRWYVPFYHAKSIQTTLLGLCFTCSIMKQNLPSWSISAMPKVRGSIVHINAFSIFTSRLFDFRSDHHFEKHQHVCLRFCVKPDFVQFMWYNIHLNRSGTFILSDVRHHSTSSCESVAPKKTKFHQQFRKSMADPQLIPPDRRNALVGCTCWSRMFSLEWHLHLYFAGASLWETTAHHYMAGALG